MADRNIEDSMFSEYSQIFYILMCRGWKPLGYYSECTVMTFDKYRGMFKLDVCLPGDFVEHNGNR
jgi:hypothetical protein